MNKAILIQKYVEEKRTQQSIADQFGIGRWTVGRLMKRYGISRRTKSDCSRGSENSNWKGGRVLRKEHSGTRTSVFIYSPNHPLHNYKGYVSEHRLIAEKALGRYLKKSEVVHHINGNPTDNRNFNLLICTLAYHHGLHRRMEIKKYGTTASVFSRHLRKEIEL